MKIQRTFVKGKTKRILYFFFVLILGFSASIYARTPFSYQDYPVMGVEKNQSMYELCGMSEPFGYSENLGTISRAPGGGGNPIGGIDKEPVPVGNGMWIMIFFASGYFAYRYIRTRRYVNSQRKLYMTHI